MAGTLLEPWLEHYRNTAGILAGRQLEHWLDVMLERCWNAGWNPGWNAAGTLAGVLLEHRPGHWLESAGALVGLGLNICWSSCWCLDIGVLGVPFNLILSIIGFSRCLGRGVRYGDHDLSRSSSGCLGFSMSGVLLSLGSTGQFF